MEAIIVAQEIVDLQGQVAAQRRQITHYLAALERIAKRRREMAERPAQASAADALFMGDVAMDAIGRG